MRGGTGGAFDPLASAYDAWYETPLGRLVDRLEKDAVFALLEPQPGALALDLSCGTGNYSLALAERGFRVVGVDVSAPMLSVARTKAAEAGIKVSLVRADGTALPFRAAAFDLVTVILGLEFVGDPATALAQVGRVLKPEGRLVVAILNRIGLWTLWRRLKRRFVRSVWRRAMFLGVEDLERLMGERGFGRLRRRGAVYFLPMFGGSAVRYLERWEALGARWMPARATFVVITGQRA